MNSGLTPPGGWLNAQEHARSAHGPIPTCALMAVHRGVCSHVTAQLAAVCACMQGTVERVQTERKTRIKAIHLGIEHVYCKHTIAQLA